MKALTVTTTVTAALLAAATVAVGWFLVTLWHGLVGLVGILTTPPDTIQRSSLNEPATAPANSLGDSPMIEFDVPLIAVLQLVLGVALPVLVGLVTTRATSAGAKAILLALLSVVTSLLTEVVRALETATTYNLGLGLLLGLGTFIVAVATHYGLLKPTGVSAAAQRNLRTADTIPGETVSEHTAKHLP